jgi:hypothetical protein
MSATAEKRKGLFLWISGEVWKPACEVFRERLICQKTKVTNPSEQNILDLTSPICVSCIVYLFKIMPQLKCSENVSRISINHLKRMQR